MGSSRRSLKINPCLSTIMYQQTCNKCSTFVNYYVFYGQFFWRNWQHIVLGPGPMFTIHYLNYIPKYKILDRYSTLYKIHSEVWVKTKSLFGKVQSESEVELWCLMFWLVHIHNFWQKYYVVKDKYIGFKFWGKAELGKSLESPNPKLKNQVRSSPPSRDQS